MKAAFIRKTGGPEVIEWAELPDPEIENNEVLVKVSAVAVNPVDTYFRAGKYPIGRSLETPFVVGLDMVGVVETVGSAVKQFEKGQRVWSNSLGIQGRQGSFSEYVAVEENRLYLAPDGVDDLTIVAVAQSAATACMGMLRAAMLKASDTLFINGGSGNVGSSLIQLAKARGARVVTSTSGQEKMAWCQSLGADLVLDYAKADYEQKIKELAVEGVNVFWDTSTNPNFDLGLSILAQKGRIVLMAGSGSRPPFPVGPFYNKECSMKGLALLKATASELKECADIINRCLREHKLKAKIAQQLPLSEAAKAHTLLEKGGIWGKVVLVSKK